MIVSIDDNENIAIVEPDGPLSESDFEAVTKAVDTHLEKNNRLGGLIIYTKDFPGWDSFGSFLSHLKFVRDHHNKISRVAIVTDSVLGDMAETFTGHFVSADVKDFAYRDFDAAKVWAANN